MAKFLSTKHLETALRYQAALLRDARHGRRPEPAELAMIARDVRDTAARLQAIADEAARNSRAASFPHAACFAVPL